MRMSNYFWIKLEVAVVYKRNEVAIELNNNVWKGVVEKGVNQTYVITS